MQNDAEPVFLLQKAVPMLQLIWKGRLLMIDLKQVEEQFDVKEIYTPLSIAKKEIRKRWNDKELRKKVEDFLGEIPEIFKKEPSAVLARHVTAPNSEFFHFLELVRLTSLKPVNLEYLKDKYVSCNPAKLYLGKMCFFKKDENYYFGKKHGTQKYYNENGTLIYELNYYLGDLQGECKYYTNGKLSATYLYYYDQLESKK